MENWGLITYRETRLNIDPDYCGYYEKERVTTTIAHELVHQVSLLCTACGLA
jgi:aminopeptidase N